VSGTAPSTSVGELVRAVVVHDLPGSTLQLPSTALPPRLWSPLVAQITRERLTGQLLAAANQGALAVTSHQREQLQTRHRRTMSQALRLEQTLVTLDAAFRANDVDVRVSKGAAVSNLDYDGTWRRGFGDLDLLVRSEQVETAQHLLTSLGFARDEPAPRVDFDKRFGKSSTFIDKRGAEVDLHRTFVMGPYGLSVDLSQLWSEPADSFVLGEARIDALGPVGRLLHTCYVAVLGDFPPRITPQRDLAEMLLYGKANPDQVTSWAQHWGAEAVLATAIRETWRGFALTDETALTVWAERYQLTHEDRRLLALYRRPDAPYAALALSSVSKVKGVRRRAAFIYALSNPGPEFLDRRGSTLPRYLLRGAKRALSRG